jgi:HK97 family phage prohead protease
MVRQRWLTVADEESLTTRPCSRQFALEDLHVRSDGSGRVVEAYAAVFNTRAEIMDQDGHYFETLAPNSFDRTIQHKGPSRFGVLFNHGMTITGAPNPAATMPIGVPLEVKPDKTGVWTATRYLDNPLADQVLDAIKSGAIRAQSFSGRFTRSQRSFPDGRGTGKLPVITRSEVDMREYGPAVFAAYEGAAILGTRSVDLFVRALLATPPDKRDDFLKDFEGLTTPAMDSAALDLGTPSGDGPAATDDPASGHSAQSLRSHIRAERSRRGI